MKSLMSKAIAISLLGIVATSPMALSFPQFIGAKIDGVKLQQRDEQDLLAVGCRRVKGTRGPCRPPSPWG